MGGASDVMRPLLSVGPRDTALAALDLIQTVRLSGLAVLDERGALLGFSDETRIAIAHLPCSHPKPAG